MQTGLFIESLHAERRRARELRNPFRWMVATLRAWATSYDLGSDEKIRRFTGGH